MSSNPSLLLSHPEVAKTICCTLARCMPGQDVEDARQEVYVRALRFFRIKPDSAPKELPNMKAFCARVARNYAITQKRKAKRQRELLAQKCPPAEYGAVARESLPRRDPVDVESQLEVLADLFREGSMPQHGVDILEGVASRCSYEDIGMDLGITAGAVEGRMRKMRKIFRKRMASLGLFPQMQSLQVIIGDPSAIRVLRQAA